MTDPLSQLPLTPSELNHPRAAGAQAEKAGEMFEAYLVAFLAKEMRGSVPDGPFSSGPMQLFAELFDQEIGRRVAEGPGMGIKDQIVRALHHEGPHAQVPQPDDFDPAGGAQLTSGFGLRRDPIDGAIRRHSGVDIGAAEGAPIAAARAGVVRFAGRRDGYGNVVIVDHGDGLETLYAHCEALKVEQGVTVQAGERIATVGQTGRATGPHLHFEVRLDGQAIDPGDWLAPIIGVSTDSPKSPSVR